MCFSAGASFGAAAVLGAAGVVIINKVKDRSQLMFASMPLFFAMQQVTEGFEWLSFKHSSFEGYHIPMMYGFLFFAQIFWPSWVPISIWKMERDKKRKKLLGYLSVIGVVASSLMAYRLLYLPVTSDIEGHHIRYDITSPQWMIIATSIMYVISTLISPVSSTLTHMKTLGLVMLTALIVTQIFYTEYLISVWCFFSALLSFVIYFVVQSSQYDRSHLNAILHKHINSD